VGKGETGVRYFSKNGVQNQKKKSTHQLAKGNLPFRRGFKRKMGGGGRGGSGKEIVN